MSDETLILILKRVQDDTDDPLKQILILTLILKRVQDDPLKQVQGDG